MRIATRLFIVCSALGLATACSSYWQEEAKAHPVAVDLEVGDALVDVVVWLERGDAADRLPCTSLWSQVDLTWLGPDGFPLTVDLVDRDGDPLGDSVVTSATDEALVATIDVDFVRSGASRCRADLSVILHAEDGTMGELQVGATARSQTSDPGAQPQGDIRMWVDVAVAALP